MRLTTALAGAVLALALSWFPGAGECAGKTTLQIQVETAAEQVFLADLLPAAAPQELRRSAQRVLLGFAPEPGAIRELSRWQLESALRPWPELRRSLFLPEQIVVTRVARRVTVADLAGVIEPELKARGLSLNQADLEMQAAPEVATQAQLRVLDAKYDPAGQRLLFRIGVVGQSNPAPFLVSAKVPAEAERDSAPPRRQIVKRAAPVVKRGQKLPMYADGSGFRMTLPVVCLQNGGEGEVIKVRDPQSKKIYKAQVNAGALKAVF